MDSKLQERLSKFGEDMDWPGISTEDMYDITSYTLKALLEYLEEQPSASYERDTIKAAIEVVDTFCT